MLPCAVMCTHLCVCGAGGQKARHSWAEADGASCCIVCPQPVEWGTSCTCTLGRASDHSQQWVTQGPTASQCTQHDAAQVCVHCLLLLGAACPGCASSLAAPRIRQAARSEEQSASNIAALPQTRATQSEIQLVTQEEDTGPPCRAS